MAVDITAVQLAANLRIGDGVTALVEPQASIIGRILAAATEMVTNYAPDAPDTVKTEGVVRLAGYLYDAVPGNSNRMSNPLADSGAMAILARFRVVRALPLTDEDEAEDEDEA